VVSPAELRDVAPDWARTVLEQYDR
jgi:hypothetical protein